MQEQSTYARLREELEEIVVQVRSKDVPLEKSLDLFDEALRLGAQCVESIDRTDFSQSEYEQAGQISALDEKGANDPEDTVDSTTTEDTVADSESDEDSPDTTD